MSDCQKLNIIIRLVPFLSSDHQQLKVIIKLVPFLRSGHQKLNVVIKSDIISLALFVLQACKDGVDAIMFLFSFVDKGSFDEIPQLITRLTNDDDGVSRIVLGTKYPSVLAFFSLFFFKRLSIFSVCVTNFT